MAPEIPGVLGALCQEPQSKTKYIVFLYHTRTALECLPSLLPPQLAVPYLRTLLLSRTAGAFLFYILLYPLD